MKKNYFLKTIFAFCFLVGNFLQSQTYNIDSSGFDTCPTNTGINATFNCVFDGDPPINLGTFIDTNFAGMELSTMSVTIYNACDGDFEIFLNNVSIATDTNTGTTCSCEAISSNPNITINLTIGITPAIQSAYVIGGNNTLSISSSNSADDGQCIYGADITVTTNTLSIEDFESVSVKVSPNPAYDRISIKGLKNINNYSIYDVFGNETLKGSIIDNGEIVINKFSNRLYFLKFDNGNAIKFIKK